MKTNMIIVSLSAFNINPAFECPDLAEEGISYSVHPEDGKGN